MKRLVLLLILPGMAAPAWCAYAYKATITIPYTQVSGSSDLTNYTVAVKLNDASFKTTGGGGQIRNTATVNGQSVPTDLIFTSDSNGSTYLKWAIESYDGTNGVVWAHVKLPTLSRTVNTVFYVLYGNTGAATFQGGTIGSAFDSYTVGFWPLMDGTALNGNDFSASGNHLTGAGTSLSAIAGVVDGAASFGGAGYLNSASSTGLPTGSGDRTMSIWVQITAGGGTGATIFYGTEATNQNAALAVYNSQLRMEFYNNEYSGNGTLTANAWHYVCAVVRSSGSLVDFYIDGSLDVERSISGSINTTLNELNVGRWGGVGYSWTGYLDQAKISNSARSAGWIGTEYNNGIAVTTFAGVSGIGACSGNCGGGSTAAVTLTPIIL